MEARIDYYNVAPEAAKIMMEFEKYIRSTNLDHSLLELVKMRASQINSCAFCLDMHSKDARANGETEQRLYGLNAWRETDYYTDRERAALALTEAITEIPQKNVPDELYNKVREQFDENDFVDLVYAINTINSWNRIAITMRAVPGRYQPSSK